MNRRTLFGFLAALPGFAFLAAKKADALPVTVISQEDFKPRKLGVYERMPYNPGTHTEFYRMFRDIRKHVAANPGYEVLPCDEPKRGQMGFAVGGPDEYQVFSISVHDLKSRYGLLGFNEAQCDALRHLIRSSTGRREIAKVLAGQSQLPS